MGAGTFTPKQRNWQFYNNREPDSSMSSLAGENTKPTLTNYDLLRLRITIAETGGKADNTIVWTIEYSTDESSWFDMPDIRSATTQPWAVGNGYGSGGSAITTRKLTDSDTNGYYQDITSEVGGIGSNELYEADYSIVPVLANIATNTTYYFRITLDGTAVPLDTGETHPQVLTWTTLPTPVMYSDDFDADPSSNWTLQNGTWSWSSNRMNATSADASYSYNSAVNRTRQFGKLKLATATNYCGLTFRFTGTESDGYYGVQWYGTSGRLYWTFWDETGHLADLAFVEPSITTDDVIGITIEGFGMPGTTVRAWINPTNSAPYDLTNWDSASDPPDYTMGPSVSSANQADHGLYGGINTPHTGNSCDDWYFGDVGATAGPSNTNRSPGSGSATIGGIQPVQGHGIFVPTEVDV